MNCFCLLQLGQYDFEISNILVLAGTGIQDLLESTQLVSLSSNAVLVGENPSTESILALAGTGIQDLLEGT